MSTRTLKTYAYVAVGAGLAGSLYLVLVAGMLQGNIPAAIFGSVLFVVNLISLGRIAGTAA